ncbi:MAG: glycoside hydrolase family 88 protein, partial [Spirochaetaceae bacterium]|nr:glycoside hydrolase family 88 protein [Spirochaetaceae bacterium]
AQPFRALAAVRDGDSSALEDVVRQFALMESKARDPRTGLVYHAWDESRAQLWANPETGCSPHFWGRAIGWFAMAIVDVIEILPRSFAGRAQLVEILGRLAAAVAPYQDALTGLWYQVVDQAGREGNYLEASVSSMLSYALAKAARIEALELLPAWASAAKAHEGACERFLAQDGTGGLKLEGTCSVAGLGGKPYRDGSYAYYVKEPVKTDDFKGVGPFILAAIEYENGRDSGSK